MQADKLNFISNKAGLVNKKEGTVKVQKEIGRWKKESAKRSCKKFSDMPYWKMASTCTAL